MASAPTASSAPSSPSAALLEQPVLGSRRLSNVLVAAVVSTGGLGFLLTSASSYSGTDLLPIGHPAALSFVPQGLVMGLYGVAAALLATYLWTVIAIDVGAGAKDIQAVKVDVRDGLNPRRRLALRIQGRRDLPLTRVGEPMPLADLERGGAELARFLGVPLEGV
jgi:hypothetical protein